MSRPLFFCIAEEAEPFARKALRAGDSMISTPFCLVDSRASPGERPHPKTKLEDHEALGTDFIGASEEDCQQWALEMGPEYKYMEYNMIVIADARSARDDTLSMQYYTPLEEPVMEHDIFGPIPPKSKVWYKFRVDYKDALQVVYSLVGEAPIDISYPIYFALKDELTDERGIFNVAEATDLVRGKEHERFGIL